MFDACKAQVYSRRHKSLPLVWSLTCPHTCVPWAPSPASESGFWLRQAMGAAGARQPFGHLVVLLLGAVTAAASCVPSALLSRPRILVAVPGHGSSRRTPTLRANFLRITRMRVDFSCLLYVYVREEVLGTASLRSSLPWCKVIRQPGYWLKHWTSIPQAHIEAHDYIMMMIDSVEMRPDVDFRMLVWIMQTNCLHQVAPACLSCLTKREINTHWATGVGRLIPTARVDPQLLCAPSSLKIHYSRLTLVPSPSYHPRVLTLAPSHPSALSQHPRAPSPSRALTLTLTNSSPSRPHLGLTLTLTNLLTLAPSPSALPLCALSSFALSPSFLLF